MHHMQWTGILGIIFGCALIALALVCGTIVMIFRMRQGQSSVRSKKYSADEEKAIQEILLGLERMEKRVDALEIILMEGSRDSHSFHGKEL
ncbi:putative phage shock protein PspB [Desulfamplus magnetovallimortis]|uniref:Putative phage shock protein PspB n=1 Tax=Desulfamplus magnetovallimortis TaxID=1246637 RepID=A0A1W1H7G9_9BACT|nr:hypothetical protein [Desulfamplus magnetovallimortis]SLM28409.1 putative phage shock protein PspB [Desulfamplus magnetovallimortis]